MNLNMENNQNIFRQFFNLGCFGVVKKSFHARTFGESDNLVQTELLPVHMIF